MIKKLNEMINDVDEKLRADHDRFISGGFTRNSVSPFGTTVKSSDMSYSYEENDVLYEIDADDYAYSLMIIGDGEDVFAHTTHPISAINCIKLVNIAKKYFNEYPSTYAFLKKFAKDAGLHIN